MLPVETEARFLSFPQGLFFLTPAPCRQTASMKGAVYNLQDFQNSKLIQEGKANQNHLPKCFPASGSGPLPSP